MLVLTTSRLSLSLVNPLSVSPYDFDGKDQSMTDDGENDGMACQEQSEGWKNEDQLTADPE